MQTVSHGWKILRAAGWFWVASGCLWGQTVGEILARVQTNTGQFAVSLPDFVCDEHVTSRALYRGRVLQSVIDSQFVGLQKKNGRFSYEERREILRVNGAEPNDAKFRGPYLFGGGFSSVLAVTFGAKAAGSQTYRVAGDEAFLGRRAVMIEFATNPGQTDLHIMQDGKSVVQRDKGKAWIDAETWQVIRIERTYLNVGKGDTPIEATIEYGEVQIAGRSFWMPQWVQVTQETFHVGSKVAKNGEYRAEYTNYRKFEAASAITFEK